MTFEQRPPPVGPGPPLRSKGTRRWLGSLRTRSESPGRASLSNRQKVKIRAMRRENLMSMEWTKEYEFLLRI
ncbi:hypothetical protein Taro_008546 [Colocasia esculenta]|uniref:Uncharacterized protein n=1 Tax=Colocasia esculenta TaxID=4460 RepID=A0A843U264_COLES|nr:hypothetical protein [Colocasia esculenta]